MDSIGERSTSKHAAYRGVCRNVVVGNGPREIARIVSEDAQRAVADRGGPCVGAAETIRSKAIAAEFQKACSRFDEIGRLHAARSTVGREADD